MYEIRLYVWNRLGSIFFVPDVRWCPLFALQKSNAIEEWAAMRENTTEVFTMNGTNLLLSVVFFGLVPYGLLQLTLREQVWLIDCPICVKRISGFQERFSKLLRTPLPVADVDRALVFRNRSTCVTPRTAGPARNTLVTHRKQIQFFINRLYPGLYSWLREM
jgi:hypothetical protein